MSPEEIREAVKEMRLETIILAAWAYADLLENGQERPASTCIHDGCAGLVLPVFKPGRYLVVPVNE